MPSASGTPAVAKSGGPAAKQVAVNENDRAPAKAGTDSTRTQMPRKRPAKSRSGAAGKSSPTAPAVAAATAGAKVKAAAQPVVAPASRAAPAPARIPSRGPDRRAQLLGALARLRKHADPYLRLCRLDRPIGYLLLLWPTWWALWAAAEGMPPWHLLLIFTLGVIVMRSAGCVINDYADRWLDPRVKRTQARPLAANELSGKQALALFFGLMAVALLLVSFTNTLTMKLAVVGAFLAASYPYLKRYTHLPQIYLGVAFGWAIPMAFAAVTGEVPKLAWLLFLANVLWATAYDTFYAMVDRDDDIRMGAKSTAILFADMDLVAIAMLQATFLLAMLFVGQQLALGWPYTLALVIGVALVAGQLWRARKRDREGCFAAFIANHWLGMVLFLGLAVGLYVRGPVAG